jgi:hypothetical protein
VVDVPDAATQASPELFPGWAVAVVVADTLVVADTVVVGGAVVVSAVGVSLAPQATALRKNTTTATPKVTLTNLTFAKCNRLPPW